MPSTPAPVHDVRDAAAPPPDRVLVVDDEEPVRRLLVRLLERAGYACTAAAGSAEARGHLRGGEFALVLCDVEMPGESGLGLIADILASGSDTAAIMVTGLDDAALAAKALELGAYGYVIKPFKPNELVISVMNALRRRRLEIDDRMRRRGLEGTVRARTAALEDALARLQRSAEELHDSREETIRRLSRAVEYRDRDTAGHIARMSSYCTLLAAGLGLDADAMRVASPLHDVGKIGVPDSILLKPGPLDARQREIMQRHTTIGYDVLSQSSSEVLELAATIAWTHHERFDGGGYPRRLAGREIPIEGRVAAVADVFDALTSDRVYRAAFPLDEALATMRAEHGKAFDPAVLDLLLGSLDEVLAIKERFSTDEPGGQAELASADRPAA